MRDDSTNLQPSWLGPPWPKYPVVRQILRVTGHAGAVYNGFVELWSDQINALRDREPCYVWEPNGIAIPSGYTKGRLVGNYAGLPLYIVSLACCVTPSSFSSVSSTSTSRVSVSPSSVSISPSSSSVSPSPSSVSSSSVVQPGQCQYTYLCPGVTLTPIGGSSAQPTLFCLEKVPDTPNMVGVIEAGGNDYLIQVEVVPPDGTTLSITIFGAGEGGGDIFIPPFSTFPNCAIACVSVFIGTQNYQLCVVDNPTCCSSSSSSSSVSSSSVSSISAAASSSVVSSNVCCPNPPPSQLGLFLTCAIPGSSSSLTFQPPPNPIPPGPIPKGCVDCTDGTPGYWTFQATFVADFLCFLGAPWVLLQSPNDACTWTSDPRDACFAILQLAKDPQSGLCQYKLSLLTPTATAVYKSDPGPCTCCQQVKMLLAETGGIGAPPLLTITPWDCIGPPASSVPSSMSSCVCTPCAVCLTQVPGNGWVGTAGCAIGVTWELVCLGNGPLGWALIVTINGQTSTYFAQPGSTCAPFNLVFFNILGLCGEWTAVINTNTAPCSSSSSLSSSSSSLSSSHSISASPSSSLSVSSSVSPVSALSSSIASISQSPSSSKSVSPASSVSAVSSVSQVSSSPSPSKSPSSVASSVSASSGGGPFFCINANPGGTPAYICGQNPPAGADIVGGPYPDRITCIQNCPVSSSSSSSSPIVIHNSCCPGIDLPNILRLTLTAAGACSCVNGSYTLTFTPNAFGSGKDGWAFQTTACNGNNFFILLICDPIQGWELELSCGPGGFGSGLNDNPNTAASSFTCTPLNINFTGIPFGGAGQACCTTSDTLTGTVTR